MNKNSVLKVGLALLLALIIILPPIAAALPSGNQENLQARPSNAWMEKFDPVLLSKVLSGQIKDTDTVTVVFRLTPLPQAVALEVKGHHDLAVNALKQWAWETQQPFITQVSKLGGQVVNRFWIDNVVIVRAKMSVIKQLALYPGVVKVFENFKVHVIEPVNKGPTIRPRPGQQVESWGIFKIDAPGAWDLGYTGQGVRIAVLDTGVDISHPALQGKMLTVVPGDPHYPGGWMEWDENGNPVLSEPHDTEGHGTHVSGTALGGDTQNILIGVAPGATLMHGLVLPGGSGTFAQVLAGIQWAVDPYYIDPNTGNLVYTGLPAHVISMSLGASDYYGDDLFPGIEAALLANIIVVAAIGNDGPGTSSNPGNIWGVFGVGATDQDDQVAWFSSGEVVNWPNPPSDWPFYGYYPSQYIKPDFSAPGVQITSSVPGGGYQAWDGTSMATPHVSGTVALILQAAGWNTNPVPNLPERVYEILKNASVDLGDPGQDTRYGWGRINASKAVEIALQYAKKSGVQGMVLDSVDQSPIPWAKIVVKETGKTYGVTSNGTFRIPLDPGTYNLTFTAWGYYNKTVTVTVILLNGTILGYVYNVQAGAPISGAAVHIVQANLTVYTNESGMFQVSVKPGTYTLEVTASGFKPANETVSVDENETVVVQIGLKPTGNGTIKGTVVDATTGQPIPGAGVTVDGQIWATTDSNGTFIIPGVPVGNHSVLVLAKDHKSVVENVTVLVNQTVNLTLSLEEMNSSVVVVGDEYGNIPVVLEEYLGNVNITAYDDMENLILDWIEGKIAPSAIVVDHWHVDQTLPDFTVVNFTVAATDYAGVPLILLDTPWSGYTGVGVLYEYSEQLASLGYPAPTGDQIYNYPFPQYVHVDMLNTTSPLFEGVVPDNDSWFYLADLNNSDYADYIFYTDWSTQLDFLANINDTYNGMVGGALALWASPHGGLWIIMTSWGESEWMQYIERGEDGLYSNNTALVLANAVRVALNQSLLNATRANVIGHLYGASIAAEHFQLEPEKYTNLTVLMERLPYGYVAGTLKGNDGKPLSGATIKVEGTPVTVHADKNGTFKFWLPKGNYTLTISCPGYKTVTVNITVKVNETTHVNLTSIPRVPRIAILYDFNGELKQLIMDKLGWYAEDFENATKFAAALNSTFFDAGIWAGYYYAPMPGQAEFQMVMDAINSTGKSVIFLDQWDDSVDYPNLFGYGIRALNVYTMDPEQRVVGDYFGDLYIQITAPSPIFLGYNVGDMVKIVNFNTQGYGTDYAAFLGFSGETLANLVLGGEEVVGGAVGVKTLPNGAHLVLMASWAPEEYQDIQWWTQDMVNIFLNAVKWVGAKPVNITPSEVKAHVGDKVTFHVGGAPANYTFNVLLDNEKIKTIVTDAHGNATFTIKIPVIPGGKHILYLEDPIGAYAGMADVYVEPKIVLSATSIETPGTIAFNITGLKANQTVMLFIDSNYLGATASNNKGVATGILNIPIVSKGTHKIVVESLSYEVILTADLDATNTIDSLNSNVNSLATSIEQLHMIVEQLNGTLVETFKSQTGELYGLIEQGNKQILAELNNTSLKITKINGQIVESYQDLENMISSTNATLVKLIKTSTGQIYALINTTKGTILAKITDTGNNINSQITSEANRIISQLNTISSQIGNLQSNITSTLQHLQGQVEKTRSRSNVATGVGGLALAVALAGIAVAFRRP